MNITKPLNVVNFDFWDGCKIYTKFTTVQNLQRDINMLQCA